MIEHSQPGGVADILTRAGLPQVRRAHVWLICGILLSVLTIASAVVALTSSGGGPIDIRGLTPVTLAFAAGGVYLLAVCVIPTQPSTKLHWVVILAVAAAMRIAMCLPAIDQGDDYERYTWDGAVVAAGVNPYRHSPKSVADGLVDDPRITPLAAEGADVLGRINHPELRTIYPPLAEGVFAVAYWISPLKPGGLRVVFLVADILAVVALLMVLKVAGRSGCFATVYLWNPLIVMETYHRLHMDILLAPALLMLAWALVRRRPIIAGSALAAAVGLKLWPLLLGGFLVGALWRQPRRLVVALAVFALCAAGMGIVFASALGGTDSGVGAYAVYWRGGDGAFVILSTAGRWLTRIFSAPWRARIVARGIMMVILAAAAVWLGLRRSAGARDLCGRMGMLALLMLLLSPAMWPWYYIAVVPLAAVAPSPALLLWTALLVLAYPLRGADSELGVSMIVHAPVWILLIAAAAWRMMDRRRKRVADNV